MSLADKEVEEFRQLRERIFDYVLTTDPSLATQIGIHKYDGRLPEGKRQSILDRGRKFQNFVDGLKKIDPAYLTGKDIISRDLGIDYLELKIFELLKVRRWERRPSAPSVIVSSLIPLIEENFAPVESRIEKVVSRIRALPNYLESSKTQITEGEEIYVEGAKSEVRRLNEIFLRVKEISVEGELPPELNEELTESLAKANRAVEEYMGWLEKISGSSFAEPVLGRELFEELLNHKKLDYGREYILKLAKGTLNNGLETMEVYADRVEDGLGPWSGLAKVESNRPDDFTEGLEWYERGIQAAVNLVKERNLATLPEMESTKVMRAPRYMRGFYLHTRYMRPGKYDSGVDGMLFVAPPSGSDDMSKFGFWKIRSRIIREVCPGKALYYSASDRIDDPFFVLTSSSETVGGWAYYCVDMARNYEFADTPEARLMSGWEKRGLGARALVDLKVSTGRFTLAEGTNFLADTLNVDRSIASRQVMRTARKPGKQVSALVGLDEIKKLKDDVKYGLGGDFSDRLFHDKMIYGGTIPLSYHRQRFNRFIDQHNREHGHRKNESNTSS